MTAHLSRPKPKLNNGLVLMVRHRASNYRMALRDEKSDAVISAMRTLLTDMLDPEIVLELTEAWLKMQDDRIERDARGRRKREPAANVG